MKGLIQRVTHASVSVNKQTVSAINTGLLLLLGIEKTDTPATAAKLCRKVINYRVFPDDQGRMNLSLLDAGGSLLVVPQFTLAADTRSGTRPGFSVAASPAHAEALFREFLVVSEQLLGSAAVGRGQFGADMKVSLENDGPVTFLLEVGSEPR